MSHYIAVTSLPADGEKFESSKFIAWRSIFMLGGVAGFAISLFLFFMGGDMANSYAFSYLWAFEVFFTITCGALFWCLLHNASNSSWGVAIRRIPETIAQSFVFLFFMGLPLVLPFVGVGSKPEYMAKMYEWIGIQQSVMNNPGGVVTSLQDALGANHETILLYKKFPYLHIGWRALPGWDWRYIIYFLLLGFTAVKLIGYSTEQDASGELQPTLKARFFSSGMLPVFAVCSTFASIDYIKSLNYTWFSTMFGVNIFAGSALSAMATIILIVGVLIKKGQFKHVVSMEHFHLMGKLMFAFTVFWAYIAFSQFFLIWYANIPEETQFYAIRNTGGWWYASLGLTFLHFGLPFILLLRRDAKRRLNFIMGMAAYTICMHMLELYWMIIPERGRSLYDAPSATDSMTALQDAGFDILAFVTFASVFGYFLIRNLSKHSVYPCGDPRLEESINVAS